MSSNHVKTVEVIQYGHCLSLSGERKDLINRYVYVTDTNLSLATNEATFRTNWKANLTAAWVAILSVGYIDDGVLVRQMDSATNLGLRLGAGNGQGNGASGTNATMLAPNYTAYIKLGTGFRGKQNRGSKHLSPLNEQDVEQGELNASMVTLMQAYKTALLVPVSDGTDSYNLAVYSPSQSQSKVNPTELISTIVTSSATDINKTLGDLANRKFNRLYV